MGERPPAYPSYPYRLTCCPHSGARTVSLMPTPG
jgi:hypothetical protein